MTEKHGECKLRVNNSRKVPTKNKNLMICNLYTQKSDPRISWFLSWLQILEVPILELIIVELLEESLCLVVMFSG